MRFHIDAKAFAAAVASVARVIESRNTIPILSNVVIAARDNQIVLKGTDLDLEIEGAVEATVLEPGETTVPARLSSDIIKKMSGDISFRVNEEDHQATISAGRSRFRVMTLPVEDFPTMTSDGFSHSFTMTGDDLRHALAAVEFSMSMEETRYYLNGVFLHRDGDKLRFVSTDGHRLARMEVPAPEGTEGIPEIIIPRKTVKEAITVASAAKDGPVQIDVGEAKIGFTAGSTVMISKLIQGTFPDYKRVIPTGNNVIAYVDAKALSAAADRVSTISTDRGRAVKLSFSNDGLSLIARSPDAGSAEDMIDVDFDADPFDIGLNSAYLNGVLKVVGEGRTRIALSDAGSPVLFKNDNDDSLLIVLMPLRV